MRVEAVFLPPVATDLPNKVCVVIDVLRATSTLVMMFEAGAERVTLSESIPAALTYASSLPERPVVCGESGGLAPRGFDRGNSPREFPPGSLEGKEVVFCTSNGTRAMRLVSNAPVVVAGSLLNGTAAVRTALTEARVQGRDIALVCSGDVLGTKFAIDDAFCAGYLATLLQQEASIPGDGGGAEPVSVVLEESATAAIRLYRSYLRRAIDRPNRESILEAFWESHNARVLREVNLAEDVAFCAQRDISTRVPRLQVQEGRLALL